MHGTLRWRAPRARVNVCMNTFRKMAFIDDGGLKINNSLLTVALRD